MDISVQVWSETPYGSDWITREGFIIENKPSLNTLAKGLAAFTYWVKFDGTETEYRLVNWIGEGQPTVICANSARGFEVGE